MLKWLFKLKPKKKVVTSITSESAFSAAPESMPEPEPLKEAVKTFKEEIKKDPGRRRILSIEKAKDHDELITVGDDLGPSSQFLHHRETMHHTLGAWYSYPEFAKLDFTEETNYKKITTKKCMMNTN